MPRRPRLSLPGIPWHIIQRGINRTACFVAEADYRCYLDHLTELSARFDCAVHAYVLITSHAHILLTPAAPDSVALMMKHLGQRYVQYVNRTYRRSGTVWEGRFRSCLMQAEDYVLACYRYIEMNSVRAGYVTHPRFYPWSSYRANGEGRHVALITPHQQYLALGRSDRERVEAYRKLITVQLDPKFLDDIRMATNSNLALGSRSFQARIEAALGRRVTRGAPGRPRKARTASRFERPHDN